MALFLMLDQLILFMILGSEVVHMTQKVVNLSEDVFLQFPVPLSLLNLLKLVKNLNQVLLNIKLY